MMTSNEVVSFTGAQEESLKKSVRLSSTSFLIDCCSRHKPAFYKVIISGREKIIRKEGERVKGKGI
jgi:hypothetical protein